MNRVDDPENFFGLHGCLGGRRGMVLPAQPTPHDDMDAETPRAEPRALEARDRTTHLEQTPQTSSGSNPTQTAKVSR
jgi:hypothetical protein